MRSRRVLLSLLSLLAAACAREAEVVAPNGEPPPPVEARAAVDRAVATTGDLITYRVEIEHDPAYEVVVPEAGAQIAGFRIVDAGAEPERTRRGRRIVERWYRLRADLVGSYVLPPVRVSFHLPAEGEEGETGAVETSALFVEVESVLPAEGGVDDIRDVKPPRRVADRWPWLWVAAAGVALAALALLLAWWRRRGRVAPTPERPAHEIAFAELERLRGTDFDDPRAVRSFHFAISETVRGYVERRFGVNATDLTTEEITAAVGSLPDLGPAERSALVAFLQQTDLVKFAHHEPSREEIGVTWERALGFVEATRPRPEAQDEPEEAPEARAA
ncbi:MAG: hypothetical protein R3325_07370 [Thermoanaerobaculia bacterium]|nr:hypothetical protein [Thermoanaerobaculia bacterium]